MRLLALIALLAAEPPADAPDPAEVQLLVYRPGGAGSATTAQKYLDQLLQRMGTLTGFEMGGKYVTSRSKADAFIEESKPSFGLLSLSAFLPMAPKYKLSAVGSATITGGGGQYFIVSKTAVGLDDCKGKTLATNHAADTKFIDNVVAGGAFKLADFEVQKTTRALSTIKDVIRDKAVCALVDDGQVADLAHVEDGALLRAVWASEQFPGLVVVDFPEAQKDQARGFHDNLPKVCDDDGKKACDAAGIDSFQLVDSKVFAGYLKAYKG